jgi:hypothetical protein
MLIHPEKLTLTTSSGSATGNTQRLVGVLRQVVVSPVSASTTYDVTITNPQSSTVYERLSETGELSEEVQLPLHGIHTVSLANATADEAFTIQLILED